MSWNNVKLIFLREVRDQLRDRRTLFMIAVLPLLLYPLLVMLSLRMSEFWRRNASRVLVLSTQDLPPSPKLIENNRFSADLFEKPENVDMLEVTWRKFESGKEGAKESETPLRYAQRVVRKGEFDAVVVFPDDFAKQLAKYRGAILSKPGDGAKSNENESEPLALRIPGPEVYHDSAQEKSQFAYSRVHEPLFHWTESIGRQNLKEHNLPADVARPFQVRENDVAEAGHKDALVWSKLLPFVLMIWALTGAFYPAVDLCAGEKERGTLETLLSSPAKRSEIVFGKLFTVMSFSMVTSLMNLLFMGLTMAVVIQQSGGFSPTGKGLMNLSPPPLVAFVWLTLALIPISAFFSALCLAVAAFARSTKEGQYYLMPLILIMMPLVVLPVLPGIELNLGSSLIPVTGLVLLLKTVLEGNYVQAAPFIPPVTVVTLCGCWLAIRWAVEQFNKESVLFREGERFGLGMWFRQLIRERQATPSTVEAVVCGLVILMIMFFLNLAFAAAPLNNFHDVVVRILVPQLTAVLTPTLIMTIMLVRRPDMTLLLRVPNKLLSIPLAVILAIVLQPAVLWMQTLIQQHLYPFSKEQLDGLLKFEGLLKDAHVGTLLLLVAVVPAVFEELAFRGFILSGLRHMGSKWQAIFWTSVFFGLVHGVIQQSISAAVLGMVLGYIAVQTGSILPGMLFHVTHNGLMVLLGDWLRTEAQNGRLSWLFTISGEGSQAKIDFTPGSIVGSLVLAALILAWFRRLPHSKTDEELLREQIDKQPA